MKHSVRTHWRVFTATTAIAILVPTALAQQDAPAPKSPPATDKQPAPQPEPDPQPPTDMPVPPLDAVGDPGVPAPAVDAAPTPPQKEPSASQPASPGVLSGPPVGDAATPRLTRRDFAGRIRRLDIFPGEAALDFLKLDHRTQVRVNAIVAERTALLDRIVRDNIDLVVKINNARQKGDNNSLPTLGRQFREAAIELTSRGSTAEEVLSILPPETRTDYRQMLDSYWGELREQMLTEAKQRGETTTFRQIIDREVDRIWTGEIRRSYERQVGQRVVNYDDALAQLALDDETLNKCKEEIQTVVAKRPTLGPDERRDLFSRVYKLLDLDRQAKFTAFVLALPAVKERSIQELAASLPPPAKDPPKAAKAAPPPKAEAKAAEPQTPEAKPGSMMEMKTDPMNDAASPTTPAPAAPSEPQRPKTDTK